MPASAKINKIIKDYGPYLDDLWRLIYRLAIIFMVIFVAGFFGAGWIIQLFIKMFHLNNVTIVVTSPFQFIDLAVDVGIFLGFLFCVPAAIWGIYSFIRPAVSKKEFFALIWTLPSSLILFLFGFAYGFFALYWGLQGLAQINSSFGLQNFWDIGLFMSQLFMTAVLLGIIFQFPIIMSALIKLGVISRQFFIDKRRVAYVVIVIIVSLLPPTDGVSLIIMSAPLILMYEFVILITRAKK